MKIYGISFNLVGTIVFLYALLACSSKEESIQVNRQSDMIVEADFHYLALGDSYTVGEGVSFNQSYPSQLTRRLETDLNKTIDLEIIAVTGWRTDDLLHAINRSTGRATYDFATLLIGVNDQFQGRTIPQFENEVEILIQKAIDLVGNDHKRLIILSIPDYAYTPFAQNTDSNNISNEIDAFNTVLKSLADQKEVDFVNITDISRRGLDEP